MKSRNFVEAVYFSLLLISATIFLLCIITGGFVLFEKFRSSSGNVGRKVFDYQFTEVNLTSDERSNGMISIPIFIEEDDSISYQIENGNHVLISNFGNTNYRCTGSCYCESNRRASGAITLSRTLHYLVASISTFIAYSKAREYFSSECEEQLTECDASLVSVEIDNCDEFAVDEEDDEDEYDGYEYNTRDGRRKRYFCRGNCLPSKDLKSRVTRVMSQEFQCDRLQTEGEIEFICPYSYKKCNLKARAEFQKRRLTTFCRKSSAVDYWYVYPNGKKREKKPVTLCANGSSGNPTIKCFDIGFMEEKKKVEELIMKEEA